ncbi:UNVERIFIED_ORG: nucleotidyltransferase/DNA polymerase involved in DNA repair [Methylorubrum zatmanii]|nr:nucleotidyltransferase/DNA polymerase involved in DNA repair [Methylorubrum extorquens]MDF9862416.1 nucleotidyltransferase/DNA polymerase involved in DNA repair [Methylorubrum pseudosasae]
MPDVKNHSIDKSFLDLTGSVRLDRVALAGDIRATVRASTGIPTCVGIGATKTLAKLANHIAKSVLELDGICDLTEPAAYEQWLCRIHIGERWGVGRASLPKLEAHASIPWRSYVTSIPARCARH